MIKRIVRWALRLALGSLLLAAYELLLDGSGVGLRQRLSRLTRWAKKDGDTDFVP